MDIEQLMLHVEALIFASERPLPKKEIVELLEPLFEEEDIRIEQIDVCINAIREKYDAQFYPFALSESGGGYVFLTKKAYHKTVLQLNGDKYVKKLSLSAMETLSIIAYKQPIAKSEIEYIRGVSCDYSIQKLLEKELIIIAGRNENAVGKPLIYATSKNFMDYLGINSHQELPKLKEIMPQDIVVPTNASEAVPEEAAIATSEEEAVGLIVDEEGELKSFSE